MVREIAKLYGDLNHDAARFTIPFKTLFLCGGEMSVGDEPPASLRDYLYRTRNMRLPCKIVLAEAANQLYRDTSYTDLIEFEEDIARIASIVLVITESPGSLAELGAFTVNQTIRRSLRIIAQSRYQDAESFIRYGPIQRVNKSNPDRVGFIPWRETDRHRFIVSSARPHFIAIREFIRSHIENVPSSRQFISGNYDRQIFYIIYWIAYLLYAASISVIEEAVRVVYPNIALSDIKDKIYCLRLMNWIGRESYLGKEYFFALGDRDPVNYKFPRTVKNTDPLARAATVRRDADTREKIPKHISELVVQRREALR